MVQVLDLGRRNPWSQGINSFFEGYTPNAVKQLAQQRKSQNIQELLGSVPKNASMEDIYRAGMERGLPSEEVQELMGIRQKQGEMDLETSKVEGVKRKEAQERQRKQLESSGIRKLSKGEEPTEEEELSFSPETQRHRLTHSEKISETQQKKQAERDEVSTLLKEAGKTDEEVNKLTEFLTPTSAREILKAANQPELFESEVDKILAKQQGEFRAESLKDYQAAIESEPRIREMETRAESGKLSTPLMVKLLDTMGIPLSVLGNPDTEEYRKFEYDWLKDAQNYFPGQVRVFEAQSFLKSIPGLMMSDAGKKTVMKYLKAQNDAKKLKYKTVQEIIKENKGKIPMDLDFQTYERIGSKLSELGSTAKNAIREAESTGPTIKMYDEQGNEYSIPSMNSAAIEAAVNKKFSFAKPQK